MPGFSLESHEIEFFVHSPFAERVEDGLLERNDNCVVMQATIRAGGRDTRFLITALIRSRRFCRKWFKSQRSWERPSARSMGYFQNSASLQLSFDVVRERGNENNSCSGILIIFKNKAMQRAVDGLVELANPSGDRGSAAPRWRLISSLQAKETADELDAGPRCYNGETQQNGLSQKERQLLLMEMGQRLKKIFSATVGITGSRLATSRIMAKQRKLL